MPEGDTIYCTAARLRDVLLGHRLYQVQSRDPRLPADSIEGHTVRSIETRGKHLLLHLDGGHAVHSHLGMTGSWHIYIHQQPWQKPRHRAVLVLHTAVHVVICFSPKLLELLNPTALRRHPMLTRLGPDILAPEFDVLQAVTRLRGHGLLPIGEAIMNQTIVCGIGNIYKSETLFLTRQNPFCPIAQLADDRLAHIVTTARQLMAGNLGGYPRRTRRALGGSSFWVYGREAQPCFRCRRRIQVRRQGDLGRTTFWCPRCQEG